MEQNMYKNESFEEDGPGATVFFQITHHYWIQNAN